MYIKSSRLLNFGIVLFFVMMTAGISSAAEVNVELVGSYATADPAEGVAILGKYAYVIGSLYEDGANDYIAFLDIVDITNPSSPKYTGSFGGGLDSRADDVAVSSQYAYIATTKGLYIVDIRNPSSPTQVSRVADTYDATDVSISGRYAYVIIDIGDFSNPKSYLDIVDITNPVSPRIVGSYETAGSSYDIAIEGKYAYVADGDNGLVILDISNPLLPTIVSSCVTGFGVDVAISGNYAYVLCDFYDGIMDAPGFYIDVVDITNPSSPKLLSSVVENNYGYGSPYDIAISGNYAYIATSNGLAIVDLSNRLAPTLAGSYDTASGVKDVAVSGNNVYLAAGNSGLLVLRTEIQDEGPIEGSLVQVQGSPEVYLIENGMKRHFTSPEALEWNGYSFSTVIQVSSESLASIQNGADISITQAIIDKYHKLGGASFFGATKSEGELIGEPDQDGNYCSYVNFEKGAIECFANGPNERKAYAIVDQFYKKWASMGYGKSVLGYPIGDMSEERTSSKNTLYKYQLFTNGTQLGALEWNLNTNQVFEVHGAIFAKWAEIGFASSVLGLPTGDEQDIPSSKYGTVGRYGTFENGHIHWNKATGVSFVTYGDLNECYNNIQGTQSDLGFPIMSQVGTTDGHDYCEFEKGYIEWNENSWKYEPNYGPTINQRIDVKLKAKPNFPQYLLDPNYVGRTSVLSVQLSDFVLKTDLTGQYDKLYNDGIMYYGIRNSYLHNAKKSLKNNDITGAEKFLERADKMQKCSYMSFQAANDVFVGSTESAEILAQGVRDECEFICNVGFGYTYGSLSILGKTVQYKDAMFATFACVDICKEWKINGFEEGAKQGATIVITNYITSNLKYDTFGGKTLEEAIQSGSIDLKNNPTLAKQINVEIVDKLMTAEVRKTLIENGFHGIAIGAADAAAMYFTDKAFTEVVDYFVETMCRMIDVPIETVQSYSPVELRVYDSTGRVTGLVNGVVKNEIPNSIYEPEREKVFICMANDTYRYETIGTANATYGLKIVHYENMKDQEIILTDVPVTINVKHIYNVDWENEAQVNKTVAIEEDFVSPQSISNIQSLIGSTWLNFTWTNPTYPDFNYTEIYLDGTFQTNTTAEYFNVTGLQLGTSYTISLRTVDINGNVSNTWVNLTATTLSDSKSGGGGGGSGSSSSSKSNSGGGGGGGAGSVEDFANVALKDVANAYLMMDANATYQFSREGNPIQSISLYSLKNSGEITSTIEVLNNRSKLVNSTPEGSIYKYVNIWVGKSGFATAANIKDAKVKFKVNNSWLQDMALSPADIKLQRYNGTAWEILPTTIESNAIGYVILEAQTPGFSPFAITAEKALSSPTSSVTETESHATGSDVGLEKTPSEKSGIWTVAIGILLIGVCAAGYMYLKKR